MKKIILFLISVLILTGSLILSCKKNSVNQINNSNNVQSKIDAIVTSCPPGYSSCSADCLFTGCSACWDPKIYEGGCGCYHGFSDCKTEKKPTAGARTTQGNISRAAYIRPQKISKYLKFLESLNINHQQLKLRFEHFDKSKTDIAKDRLEIAENEYSDFLDTYKSIINSLDATNLSKIKTYIDRH